MRTASLRSGGGFNQAAARPLSVSGRPPLLRCLVAVAMLPLFSRSETITIRVDVDRVVREDFWGVGVEWSAYPWWDLSEQDWDTVFKRVEYLRLPMTRVMQDAFYYCKGWDNGQPIYDFESRLATKLYKLLDWCESNNCRVIFGEWGHPQDKDKLTLANTDPRWPRLFCDCLEELVRRRGYSCIQAVNLINEPHGWWARVPGGYLEWRQVMQNLAKELEARGLAGRLPICMPDGERLWTTKILKDDALRSHAGVYDEHWYVTAADVRAGIIELRAREQRRQINRHDPTKPYLIGELGLVDGKTEDDKQPNVHKFWYGVAMADAATQLIRGGVSGIIAWDLDDAMHFVGDGDIMTSLEDAVPADAYARRKVWGMWNSLGAENGDPEDENLRPWFFAWSLFSRYFPAGCETLECDAASVPLLHVAAARTPTGDGRHHLTIVIVNNDERPHVVRLVAPGLREAASFARYEYFDRDGDNRVDSWPSTTDAAGGDRFPTPSAELTETRLAKGMEVALAGQGIVLLTTIDRQPVLLGAGAAATSSD